LGNSWQGFWGASGLIAFTHYPIVFLLVAVAIRGLESGPRGDGYSCQTAVQWIRKFSATHIPIRHNGNVTLLKGPKGWYSSAFPDKNGIAYAGGCESGGGGGCLASNNYGQLCSKGADCRLAGGKEAFGWNSNVANRKVGLGHTPDGKMQLFHVSGADTNVSLPVPQR
jgi:hypothetical protein